MLPMIANAQQVEHGHDQMPHVALADASGSDEKLPAAGHRYRVDFGGGNAFEIAFGHAQDMTFTKLQPPNQGQVETIHYRHQKLRDGLYMVYWQEQNKTTVVHVEDFAEGQVYSNITSPDGTFFNGYSRLVEVK